MVFHVLNRAVGRRMLFAKDGDFLAFERVMEETLRTRRMRLCAYCLMPNHWHLVVWPEQDGDLPAFMQQMTNTHVKRWKEHRHEIGYGHLYQGRYKCFPVETEDYFYQVVRYVERNALRANLVERAEAWRWSSLRRAEREDPAFPILSAWPLPRPADWLAKPRCRGWTRKINDFSDVAAVPFFAPKRVTLAVCRRTRSRLGGLVNLASPICWESS
jgi:putative transposase